ncbi:MAG: hypothetical protein ABIB71_02510 [Candidatus Woesearchaeota archaeon]
MAKREGLKEYYSSHEVPCSIKEFIELEVKERKNYSMAEVRRWMKRYGIRNEDKIIWVSDKKWVANRYNLGVDKWDNAQLISEDDMSVCTFTSDEGFIIPESDDGDDGYVFVFRKGEG